MTRDKTSPDNFNQSSLQDFLVCPRRFELKYLQETIWPAAHSDPPANFEELTEIGDGFHQLCNQYFSGLSSDQIRASISNPKLLPLWDSFLPFGSEVLDLPHFSEQILRVPFQEHILIGKFDLIVRYPDDNFTIIDWKTSPHKPDRSTLAKRVQTILYPYILLASIGELFDIPSIDPEQITLQYWYPLASKPEENFPYSPTIHQENIQFLADLLDRIDKLAEDESEFPLTDDLNDCKFCVFRSYCERGTKTPVLDEIPDYEGEDLSNAIYDMDLIEELEF